MKKIFIILVSAFAFSAAMPVYAETVNNQVVAVQQDDEPVTREILIGNWQVEKEGQLITLSFDANGKLLISTSQTSSEEGMDITIRMDIKNVDWNVELGKLILKFDKAAIDIDVELPEMLAPYKAMFTQELDKAKQQFLEEANKEFGGRPVDVEMLDEDTILIQFDDEEKPNTMVRIKDEE